MAKEALSSQPKISNGKSALQSNAFMLQGQYKCDLRTRLFFKSIIGEHFHFTVYGHDWVKKRWAENNPPTYLEFAQFWQQEYQERKAGKISTPKREWAYINFLQQGGRHADWHEHRRQKVAEATLKLKPFLEK